MKGHINIHPKTGIAYIPKNLRDEGFIGENIQFLTSTKTVILLHPNATLAQIAKSLKIILLDIRLRTEKTGKSNTAEANEVKEEAACPKLI